MDTSTRPEERREPLSPGQFRLFAEILQAYCGLLFREETRCHLERRVRARMRANGLSDFGAYYAAVRAPGSQAELNALVEAVTTHETWFFREGRQLDAFSRQLLPRLHEALQAERRLRIWSAGCSTGEEAYTVAMLVRDSGLFDGWTVEVIGTDLSQRVLAAAARGVYGSRAVREVPAAALNAYFTRDGRDYRVSDEIRSMVRFSLLNLLDERAVDSVPSVDVVFCRNVLIYFDLATRRRVLRALRSRLIGGGFLLLGHSETLVGLEADFEWVQLREELVYRKPVVRGPGEARHTA